MADEFKFDFDEMFTKLKEWLPIPATNYVKGTVESFFGNIKASWGTLLEIIGLGSWVDGFKNNVKGIVDETSQSLIQSADPDFGTAKSGTLTAINAAFEKIKTGVTLSPEHFDNLKQSALDVKDAFYKDGIPPLDKDLKLPKTAFDTVEKYRKLIVAYLTGGTDSAGVLPLDDPKHPEKPKRADEAERIATLITGMTKDDTWETMSGKETVNGLAGSLAGAQRKRFVKGFEKGDLTEADVKITLDTELLASTVQNSGASNGSAANPGDDKSPAGAPPKPKPPKIAAAGK